MTDVISDVTAATSMVAPAPADALDEQLVQQLSERARAEGLRLTGEGGLLSRLTKMVVESALEGEMEDHLGYARHDPAGRDGGNSRNGTRSKELLTEAGPVQIAVPRDRDGSFTPELVRKRQRRLSGLDDLVISLSAKGLTYGEICAHLAEVYGAEVSKQTISTITEKVLEGLSAWQSRPLDPVYPVIFIDAVIVKIRDGQVTNRPIYVALAVTCEGTRDILGLWAGEHGDGEGAKYWLRVLSEIKNRGTQDCLIVVCDGLKGLPEAIATVWPQTITQTCIVHLLRNSFRYASKKDWSAIAKDLKPVYTAASESDALDRFVEFSEKWEKRYPAIIRLWTNAWAEFVPFLQFDREIRTIICTTNAIESINARIRRAVNARGHFPTEQAALKCVYLAVMSLDPTGTGRQRWSNRWKAALNAFEVTFDGRLSAGKK
ncbi:putative transposase [Arthrobacter sp. V4I6]|nr:putative transposase [Arthrobacter sp. V1I7]MDQ0821463.1 putative transposase [Arthrobacter sp. V1I7]MDQ0853332.1 putative transposase [Arthrobacter sp. V4I6]MDQ0855729.1 putative transposase [Arthrobacter sp. V4I6]